TGEISVAAQLAAQSLGPEFKQWLNDPQKLLQLIAAAQGATSGGGGSGEPGGAPLGSVPNVPVPAGMGTGPGGGGGTWNGQTVPLQEEEVIQAIRMLTHFGQAAQDPNASPEKLTAQLTSAPEGAKLNLAALLESLSSQVTTQAEQSDTPLLMKAAE